MSEIDARRLKICRLRRRGCPVQRIAKIVGKSERQVQRDLIAIDKAGGDWKPKDKDLRRREIEAQYDDALWQAWQAWFKSKRDATSHTEKQEPAYESVEGEDGKRKRVPTGEMVLTEVVDKREGRLPDNRYMVTILQILQAKRELWGLDEPKKVDVRKLSINFADVAKSLPDGMRTDEVEQRLAIEMKQLEGTDMETVRAILPNGLKELNDMIGNSDEDSQEVSDRHGAGP